MFTVQLRFTDTNVGQDPSMLPVRHLPPGNVAMLHSQCSFKVSHPVRTEVLCSSCATVSFRMPGWDEVQPLCAKIQIQMGISSQILEPQQLSSLRRLHSIQKCIP